MATIKGYSQEKQFKFMVNKPIILDSVRNIYFNQEMEYSYKRIYLENNILEERGLFTINKEGVTTATFKKENTTWFLRNQVGDWTLFYSDSIKFLPAPEIFISGKKYIVRWTGTENINGQTIQAFRLKPVGFTQSDLSKFYFDPEHGIIGFEARSTTFIRNDLIKR